MPFRQPYACDESNLHRSQLALPPITSPNWKSPIRAFVWGMTAVASTVLTLVLFATYLGIGALAHDTHFSLGWVLASTALVWAGPAQIILISTGLRRHGGAGGDRRDGQRDSAVSDGGFRSADDTDATD